MLRSRDRRGAQGSEGAARLPGIVAAKITVVRLA